MKVTQSTTYCAKGTTSKFYVKHTQDLCHKFKTISPVMDRDTLKQRWKESNYDLDSYEDKSLITLSDYQRHRCQDHELHHLGDGCFYKSRHGLSDGSDAE